MHNNTPKSVGIDVAKAKIDVALLMADHSAVTRTFPNTTAGIHEAISFFKQHGTAATVPCVIESTGDYHLLTAFMLTEAAYAVKCINPLITKRYQRASVRNAKNDRIDAARLALIGLSESALPHFTMQRNDIVARKVVTAIAKLETVRQQLSSHLRGVAQTCDQLGVSIDLSVAEDAVERIEEQITLLKKKLIALSSSDVTELAEGVKGLSTTQSAILGMFLSGHTFTHRDQLIAFCGLDVSVKQSGSWVGRAKLSKRGNAYLRKILFQIAWGLKLHEPRYREYYEKLRLRKLHYTSCLLAVARKFLRYYFAFHRDRLSTVSA